MPSGLKMGSSSVCWPATAQQGLCHALRVGNRQQQRVVGLQTPSKGSCHAIRVEDGQQQSVVCLPTPSQWLYHASATSSTGRQLGLPDAACRQQATVI